MKITFGILALSALLLFGSGCGDMQASQAPQKEQTIEERNTTMNGHFTQKTPIKEVSYDGRTAGHDDRREAVDQGGVVAQRIAVDVERSDHQVVRQVINVPHLLLDAGDRNFLQGYLVRHHASLLIRFLK